MLDNEMYGLELGSGKPISTEDAIEYIQKKESSTKYDEVEVKQEILQKKSPEVELPEMCYLQAFEVTCDDLFAKDRRVMLGSTLDSLEKGLKQIQDDCDGVYLKYGSLCEIYKIKINHDLLKLGGLWRIELFASPDGFVSIDQEDADKLLQSCAIEPLEKL
jgi:hypothetical protein